MHKYHRLVSEILFSLVTFRDELPWIESGKTVIYFPDFNLIHPYVYRQTEARYGWIDRFGSCLLALNDSLVKPDNIQICISLPTALEFIYSLQKQHDHFSKHLMQHEFSSYAHRCLVEWESGKIGISDIKSEEIKHFLINLPNSSGAGSRIRRFLRSISERRTNMLTDHYSQRVINNAIKDNRGLLTEISEGMKQAREPTDARSPDNKIISYKADTHNIFLPILNEVDSSKQLNFVCSNRLYGWAPRELLKIHQRPALFLIMLIGNMAIRPDDPPLNEKMQQIRGLIQQNIEIGESLVEHTARNDNSPIDTRQRIEAYIYANVEYYINMAKDTKHSKDDGGFLFSKDTSYRDYLRIIDGNRSELAQAMRSVHDLIDDAGDEFYRDFVDDERVRKAIPTLKFS